MKLSSMKIVKNNSNTLRIIKNKNGKEVEKQLFDSDNNVLEKFEYETEKRTINKYNAAGNVISTKITSKTAPNTTQFFRYDEYNNAIFSTLKRSEYKMKIQRQKINNRDVRYFIPNIFDCVMTYNENNNICALKNNITDYSFECEFNEDGLITNFTDNKGIIEKYSYDDNGNLIRFVRTLRGSQKYIEWYKYDEDNKLIYYKTSSGKEFTVEYEDTKLNTLD